MWVLEHARRTHARYVVAKRNAIAFASCSTVESGRSVVLCIHSLRPCTSVRERKRERVRVESERERKRRVRKTERRAREKREGAEIETERDPEIDREEKERECEGGKDRERERERKSETTFHVHANPIKLAHLVHVCWSASACEVESESKT